MAEFLIITTSLILGIPYFFLQLRYVRGWRAIPEINETSRDSDLPSVTVVIVARNEARSILQCIQSVKGQEYPADHIRILVVDDHSQDETVTIARSLQVDVLELKDFPEYAFPATKKAAIMLAVHKSNSDFVLLLDADCVPGKEWVRSHVENAIHRNVIFQTGPVLIGKSSNVWEWMQAIEFHTLMLITGAGIELKQHALANGGNMMFRPFAFMEVNGYEGNLNIPSGDDLYLVEKLKKKYPDRIHFVKNRKALVFTNGKKTLRSLLRQRVRWMKKNKRLADKSIERTWWFVGLVYLWTALLLLSTISGQIPLWVLPGFLLLKWAGDAILLQAAMQFSGQRISWGRFIPSQILYALYLFLLLISSMFNFTKTSDKTERGFL